MSTAVGRLAEAEAAKYLVKHGFTILAKNWRTRWCEIDIVASKSGAVHFVEVKYRANSVWGSGLDYITPAKLRQMSYAAEFWAAQHTVIGDYRLSAISLHDSPPKVLEFVASI